MLDEGVRCAVPGARVVGYVEREAFAAGILLARMGDEALEPAPVWCGNLEEFNACEWHREVDCITAGFPCQPFSAAGKQEGFDDERWIWPAITNIIRDIRPPLVFLENVPGLVAGRGINRVLGDLAALGFDAEWCSLSAADVGASHLRERVFILAVSSRGGLGVLRQSSERCDGFADGRHEALEHAEGDTRRPSGHVLDGRTSDGPGDQLEHSDSEGRREGSRRRENVDGVRDDNDGPAIAESGCGVADSAHDGCPIIAADGEREADQQRDGIRGESVGHSGAVVADASVGFVSLEGRRPGGRDGVGSTGSDVLADGGSERSQGLGEKGAASRPVGRGDGADIFAPGPRDKAWARILPGSAWLAPAIESGFRCVVDGHAVVVDEHRADQLRAIGNGVVALQAGVAFAVLRGRLLN